MTRALATAIKRAPARISKLNGGKPVTRDKRRFDAYTVTRLLEEYRDPRAILLEIAGMDTAALMQAANCTYLDAIGERRLCAQAVLPYVAQKLPIQVDMRHTKAIHLNIVDEAQYHELLEVAETPVDDGMGMQLIGTGIANESDQAVDASTAQGDRTPVTPPVAAAAPERTDQAGASEQRPSHTTSGAE